jgi:hypothetical protein
MVLSQLTAVIGTLAGAFLGIMVPFMTSRLARRQNDIDLQRGVASEIMMLFEGGESLIDALVPQESRTRRKLYLLALRLQDTAARRACMTLIAQAGQSPLHEEQLMQSWHMMMELVGSVYRSKTAEHAT